MKRVVMLCRESDVIGGLEISFASLVGELRQRGVEPEAVVHRAGSGVTSSFLEQHLPTRSTTTLRGVLGVLRSADVVHVHAATLLRWSMPVVVGAVMARRKVVLTMHLPSYPPDSGAGLRARLAIRGWLLRALGVDVIAPSVMAAEVATRRLGGRLRVRAVENGIPDPGVTDVPRVRDEIAVAFVGRLAEHKRPLDVVEIVERLLHERVPVRAIVVGDGPLRAELEAEVARRSLHEVVELRGQLDDPLPVLQEADLLLLPSRSEGGIALVILEAAAAGRTFVARRTIVAGTEWRSGGVIVDDDAGPEAFAEAIASLFFDRERLAALAGAARSLYERSHTASAAAGRLTAIYEGGR